MRFMPFSRKSWFWFGLAMALTPQLLLAAAPAKIDFNRDIRPILSENCYACHGPDEPKRKGGLRLDQEEGALKELKSGGHAVVRKNPDQSLLIQRILASDPEDIMPPSKSGKKLSDHQKYLLRRWIQEGAPWQKHWAFVPPVRHPLPEVKLTSWPKNEIDYFILARLEQENLKPSAEGSREQLARRVSFDLTGLPPTESTLRTFLADHSPNAYEHLVERLLNSPQYGEHMAVQWLDMARYADTHGYHLDSGRDMWKWREWVINAYNYNMPFNQFTLEQIAGDLLPNPTRSQLVATGFNRNNMINFEGGAIPEEYLAQYIKDRVTTTSTVFLGLTMGCCECHDHKFDPISQKEFYQMFAYFNAVPENGLDGSKGNAAPLVELPTPEQSALLATLQREQAAAKKELEEIAPKAVEEQAAWELELSQPTATDRKSKLSSEVQAILAIEPAKRTQAQKDQLQGVFRLKESKIYPPVASKLAKADKAVADLKKAIPSVMVMKQMEKPRDTFILVRGQYNQPGEKVSPGIPKSLPALPSEAPANRLGLAQWLTDPNHPLVARVTVNRFWQRVMGTGLVKTANDFGSQGEWPTHPELLDWIAREFIDSGWDTKHVMRLLVTSATYRQTSAVTPDLINKDPYNRLYARGPRFRLSAEEIRDNALAISGLLQQPIGGPSVSPYQPPGLWEELSSRKDSGNWTAQFYVQSHGGDLYRRSLYTFWKRTSPPPSLTSFDAPDRETCTVYRERTSTPLQALILLDDPTYVEASRVLAERILREGGKNSASRIRFAFRVATSREPNPTEIQWLDELFQKQLKRFQATPKSAEDLLGIGEAPRHLHGSDAELAAWTVVSSTILNLDETITKG